MVPIANTDFGMMLERVQRNGSLSDARHRWVGRCKRNGHAYRLEGHIMLDNTDDGGGHFEPPRQMQMPVAQTVELRTKIQVQQFGNRHPEIRVYMDKSSFY